MHDLLHNFDKGIATQVAKLPSWTTPFMTLCSFLGLPAIVVTVSVVIAVVCYLQGKKNLSLAFSGAVLALGANSLIKLLVHRTRPDTLYVESMAIKSYSFPSGHAFGAMVFYGLIAYLCYQNLSKPFNLLTAILLGLLILAIGTSRVSLGAHFPSDVLVGWLLGGAALLTIIKLLKL